jgi:hypothetical protein
MKKIDLDKETIWLLEKSIAHWEKDIIQPLRRGRKIEDAGIFGPNLFWKDTKKEVKYRGVYCPLCKVYTCTYCPYYIFYSRTCDSHNNRGHWDKFIYHPSLRTAVAMKKALEKILNNGRIK